MIPNKTDHSSDQEGFSSWVSSRFFPDHSGDFFLTFHSILDPQDLRNEISCITQIIVVMTDEMMTEIWRHRAGATKNGFVNYKFHKDWKFNLFHLISHIMPWAYPESFDLKPNAASQSVWVSTSRLELASSIGCNSPCCAWSKKIKTFLNYSSFNLHQNWALDLMTADWLRERFRSQSALWSLVPKKVCCKSASTP